jgi:hypothetical protein
VQWLVGPALPEITGSNDAIVIMHMTLSLPMHYSLCMMWAFYIGTAVVEVPKLCIMRMSTVPPWLDIASIARRPAWNDPLTLAVPGCLSHFSHTSNDEETLYRGYIPHEAEM